MMALLLFEICDAVQESLGFIPYELVFVTLAGPIKC